MYIHVIMSGADLAALSPFPALSTGKSKVHDPLHLEWRTVKHKFLDLQDYSKVKHKKALSEQDELVSNFKKPNFPIYFLSFRLFF